MNTTEFAIDSCVRGHHTSRTFWSPGIGEELLCKREGNPKDQDAVALFDKNTGTVVVVEHMRYSEDLPQRKLEVQWGSPQSLIIRTSNWNHFFLARFIVHCPVGTN